MEIEVLKDGEKLTGVRLVPEAGNEDEMGLMERLTESRGSVMEIPAWPLDIKLKAKGDPETIKGTLLQLLDDTDRQAKLLLREWAERRSRNPSAPLEQRAGGRVVTAVTRLRVDIANATNEILGS